MPEVLTTHTNYTVSMFDTNIPLSKYSNYKIGGNAHYFFVAKDLSDLAAAVEKANKNKLPVFILGGGTNLLIDDKGFAGLVLKPEIKFLKLSTYEVDNFLVEVGAGVLISELLEFCIESSLSGLEWAGGLPGTVGGAIRGNAGAFRGEIKDAIVDVTSCLVNSQASLKKSDRFFPITPYRIIKRGKSECNFGYRDSIFKQGGGKEIILSATFALRGGDKNAIRQSVEDKIKWRTEKQPLDHPNIGSIFKNVDWKLVPKVWQEKEEIKKHIKTDPFLVLPAATLIDKSGLKGVSFGGAMISPKHPNFIVNLRTASAGDVKKLIDLVKITVKDKFDISLEEEIIYVS